MCEEHAVDRLMTYTFAGLADDVEDACSDGKYVVLDAPVRTLRNLAVLPPGLAEPDVRALLWLFIL